MNTPAHLAASLLIWRNEPGWNRAVAVGVGALLPDLPMFVFFGYQKWIGRDGHDIWSAVYFQDNWQLCFDVVNSIPLAILLMIVCRYAGYRGGFLLAASALVHMLCDLPVHHDDAHRHFLPLSNWRFESPLSYWDPAHFGRVFIVLELIFALAACAFVWWKSEQPPMRCLAKGTLLLYGFVLALVLAMWSLARADYAREMYSPVRESTLIVSPSERYSGT